MLIERGRDPCDPVRRGLSAGLVALLIGGLTPADGFAAPASERSKEPRVRNAPPSFVPGELLVRFDPDTSPGQRRATRERFGVERVEGLPLGGLELVKLPGGPGPIQAAREIGSSPAVLSAEPNYLWQADGVIPDDPEFGHLWGLHNTGQSGGTSDADIDAPEAWEVGADTSDLVVAVIDTGVWPQHPDLVDRMWTNPGEIPGNGVDDDGNGKVDDVFGWDFHHNDASVFDPTDPDDHGTHVAGTIAATMDNGLDVAGVSQARIMALKFLGPNGGSTANAILAIDYAISKGADVINGSWGGGGFSAALQSKIQQAGNAGILYVATAGNGGSDGVGDDNDAAPHYPSSYPNNNIISVASTTRLDAKATSSNYGLQSVDLGAPGSQILSTIPSFGKAVLAGPDQGAAFSYRSAFHSFGLEGVTSAPARAAILGAALSWMGVGTDAPILVVDDDRGQSFQTAYTGALASLGYDNVTLRTVSPPQNCVNGPTLSDLNAHRAVIWFTGADFTCTLTSTDQTRLTSYLTGTGGSRNLLLFGQDIGYDLLESSPSPGNFLGERLRVRYVQDFDSNFVLQPVAGSPYAAVGAATLAQSGSASQALSSSIHSLSGAALGLRGGQRTAQFSGTSMAAPHVTGSVLQLMERFPDKSHLEVKQRILGSVDPIPSLAGITVTGGRLNLGAAIGPAAPSGFSAVAVAGGRISLSWNPVDASRLAGYNLYRDTEPGVEPGAETRLNPAPLVETSYEDEDVVEGVTYYYVVRAVDTGGLESPVSQEVSSGTDGTPPPAPTAISIPAGEGWVQDAISATNAQAVKVAGDTSGDTAQVIVTLVQGEHVATSTVSGIVPGEGFEDPVGADTSGFEEGEVIVTAVAEDAAGNASEPSEPLVVPRDTVPPGVSIDDGPAGHVSSKSATITFSTDDPAAALICTLDGEPYAPCQSPVELNDLEEGERTFGVMATDPVGNAAGAERTWVVDTLSPEVQQVSPPAGALFASPGTDVRATFDRQVDGTTVTDQTFTLETANEGDPVPSQVGYEEETRTAVLLPDEPLDLGTEYTAIVHPGVKDLAGNELTEEMAWTFRVTSDTEPPLVSVTDPEPGDMIREGIHVVSGVATDDQGLEEVRVAVVDHQGRYWDGTSFVEDETWHPFAGEGELGVPWSLEWTVPTLDHEGFTVLAEAEDTSTNVGERASVEFIVDRVAPTGSVIIQGGAEFTGSLDVTLELEVDDGAEELEMRIANEEIDGSSFRPLLRSVPWTLSEGPDGPRSVLVQLRDPAGNTSEVLEEAIQLDTTAPTTPAVSLPGAFQKSTRVAPSWSASDQASGVGTYLVERRSRSFGGASSGWATWIDTSQGSATFDGQPGTTYCIRVTASDAVGNTSDPSDEACTAVPLNDRQLKAKGKWGRKAAGASYEGTYSVSRVDGARLVRPGVTADRLALLVTRCPKCGRIEVRFGGEVVGRFGLRAPKVRRNRLIQVASFGSPRRGKVIIEVLGSGRQARIEGLGIFLR